MNSDQFNKQVSTIAQGEKITLTLIIGKCVSGFFLRHTPATRLDGSLELETSHGIERFLSSAIDNITTDDLSG